MCVKFLQWMSRCFCSWFRNQWWGWCGSSVNSISSLCKYRPFFFAQRAIYWAWQNMSFIHKYRKFWERKSYNRKKFCTEIMQLFGSSFRILHSRYWKIGFLFFICLHTWKIFVQVKDMKCLWFDKVSLTENAHVITEKYVRYLLNNFTHNTSMVVSPFLWRYLCLSTLKNWNHPP